VCFFTTATCKGIGRMKPTAFVLAEYVPHGVVHATYAVLLTTVREQTIPTTPLIVNV
jgi:hypothetical protein